MESALLGEEDLGEWNGCTRGRDKSSAMRWRDSIVKYEIGMKQNLSISLTIAFAHAELIVIDNVQASELVFKD